MATQRALVLGGGGLAGIAWETGILAALAEHGIAVGDADYTVGTSAGATVAAQLGSGLSPAELLDRQVDPALQSQELTPSGTSTAELMEIWAKLSAESDHGQLLRRIGALALNADTVAEPARRAVIASRLPNHVWPQRKLAIAALDAYTGELRLFDRDSGVELVDAVAASCAVPGIWPPVTIGRSRYIDGGARSSNNADLAAGYARILILAPTADPALAEQIAGLRETAQVEVITPDEQSVEAFGPDPLDPAVRTPCARAGFAQGQLAASAVRMLWRDS